MFYRYFFFFFVNIFKPNDRIVYTAGAFDLFHVGLLDFLEQAKKLGDYLVVGLHSDPVNILLEH